jgi:ferritin-like metal-binding protein YciE
MAEPTTRELKLIQYLNEAYGKEKELETALTAHIAMTTRKPYKKRLQEHLRETKAHARAVERRIKQLGGKAELGVVAEAADTVASVAKKGIALAQGPLHAIRGTGEAEKMLKNAKTEYFNEHEEIATYTAIETLATALNDPETAKLAKDHRRQEERMAKFLERQIPALTKEVVREEIPARERRPASARPAASRSTASRGAASRSAASRSNGAGAAKPAASRSRAAAKPAASRSAAAKKPAASRSRSTASRSRAKSSS